jgi:hypothetical protein
MSNEVETEIRSQDPAAPDGPTSYGLPPGLRSTLKAFGAALAPPAAAVALVLFFAVRRQEQVILHFGVDDSVLNYSTQDYLLRGADTLFVVFLLLLVLGLGLLRLHAVISAAVTQPDWRPHVRRISQAAILVGAPVFVVGITAVFRPLPLPVYARTLSLGIGIGLLAYGTYLQRRIVGWRDREPAWLATTSVVLVTALIFLSIFWTTNELARALGRGHAQTLESRIGARPGVVVYSEQRLQLAGPGIVEQYLGSATDARYRFRYEGLKLLVASGDQFFLLPERWSPDEGNAILLQRDESLRFEFVRGR